MYTYQSVLKCDVSFGLALRMCGGCFLLLSFLLELFPSSLLPLEQFGWLDTPCQNTGALEAEQFVPEVEEGFKIG